MADIVVHLDLGRDQSGISDASLTADVALERRAHLEDVEIDGSGRDRLLETRVVVSLGQIDQLIRAPVYFFQGESPETGNCGGSDC